MSTHFMQEAHNSMAFVADGALPTSNYSVWLYRIGQCLMSDIKLSIQRMQEM